MSTKQIYEDKLPPKIPVVGSSKVKAEILKIENYNQNNRESLSRWFQYIHNLESYISNPVIAWDYTGKYQHRNGTTIVKELGYNVQFKINTDKSNKNFIEIINLDYNLKEFGLDVPPSLTESTLRTKNNNTRTLKSNKLSDDEFCRMLMEANNRHWHNLFGIPYKR